MDKEDRRFFCKLIALLCTGAIIILIPFIHVRIKSADMEAQGYAWMEGECQCHCPSCECSKGHWAPSSN